ncbi:MAG: peptide-methionine (R)-S-oxide reductase [Candidatus Margulisiibacteriota bacterium]|nr:MAG: peptide-methionine (R)-S-oxide reductase [Candidatus Margulisbacteria bacterium GWD2_39_127]OGI04565.1 MAG: peptide-methionine (R)-S-oxide reductase [Candidatus Margulisbacteria bacterium GWF2_38_17]OGI11902.1 MAG: peptide-methionine (R)-S-oxide reductase [Candidatus Margulisbacteria bacterium GWE2_39_32]PZM83084.1 MAG: peptide-methionine (R)-S-oxide reductase [Candidatus Margulisiibacteriota bacterium]HAR62249.1 peptide-methionine (R)-S-oxide reductase [Candidatus Margulisiibacteriota 
MENDEEWKKKLTSEEYHVMRERGTEKPFAGKYYKNEENGMYYCAACGNPLFSSKTKFNSGSGWPSFFAPVEDDKIASDIDRSHGMERVEVHCSKCGSHLGHIFNDGPAPTGKRYCVNSVSLKFEKS